MATSGISIKLFQLMVLVVWLQFQTPVPPWWICFIMKTRLLRYLLLLRFDREFILYGMVFPKAIWRKQYYVKISSVLTFICFYINGFVLIMCRIFYLQVGSKRISTTANEDLEKRNDSFYNNTRWGWWLTHLSQNIFVDMTWSVSFTLINFICDSISIHYFCDHYQITSCMIGVAR